MSLGALGAAPAMAQQDLCPSDNPVVQENNCAGAGNAGWTLSNASENVAGYATQTSFNLGQNVPLKIAATAAADHEGRTSPSTGWGTTTDTAAGDPAPRRNVAVNNTFTCNARDTSDRGSRLRQLGRDLHDPGAALPASGVYIAKLTRPTAAIDNTICSSVRDDNARAQGEGLFVVPTATYAAYNNWGGKSLYCDRNGGGETIAGTGARSRSPSTGRIETAPRTQPLHRPRLRHWSTGWRAGLRRRLHRRRRACTRTPPQLRAHKIDVISGHSEYWSLRAVQRLQGRPRRGREHRLLQRQHRLLEGPLRGRRPHARLLQDRPGLRLDRQRRRRRQRLGPRRHHRAPPTTPSASTATPARPTTTRELDHDVPRQRRATGDPNAPPAAASVPTSRRTSSSGVMYFGDNAAGAFPLHGPGRERQRRVRRATASGATPASPTTSTTTIGTNCVGWEWDAIPTQAQYLERSPPASSA